MPFGKWADMDACTTDPGLMDKYPDAEQRRRVCAALKAKAERTEGISYRGTLKPAGTDGHVHDFTVERGTDPEGKAYVRMWTSPAYAPDAADKWWGDGHHAGIDHWHDWKTAERTSEDLGHSHELPDLPDVVRDDLAAGAESTEGARVEEAADFWLVRDIVATRVGVSKGQRILKRRGVVEETARKLNGAPLVYTHPKNPDGSAIIDVDPLTAPGFAVNARMEGDAAVYDALLWKENPPGHTASKEDLERNAAFAAAVAAGEAVHNSLGTYAKEREEKGTAPAMGTGEPAAYDVVHEAVEVGHIAILAPIAGGAGSCPIPACGAVPAEQAVAAVMEAFSLPREAAVLAIVQATR